MTTDLSTADDCPRWCVADHEDELDPRVHQARAAEVPVLAHGAAGLAATEFVVAVSRTGRNGPTLGYFGDGTSQSVEMSIDSMREAARTILAYLDDIDVR